MTNESCNQAPQSVNCGEDTGKTPVMVSKKNNPFSIPRGLKLYVVKARRAGGSVVLTCPYAELGEYYHVCVDDDGVISFIPVALAVGVDA